MEVGDYVRTKYGIIAKITNIIEDLSIDCDIDVYYEDNLKDKMPMMEIPYNLKNEYIIKSSPNIIDLIEYMDLLVLEYPIKLYGIDKNIRLFNPVRCDGFTEFDDGTHCIILNMDYLVDVKDLKLKSIITYEQLSKIEYKVGE